ncbi:helix-turn-helix transcriptional regulator [Pseudodesulfovibrio sp. S3]|uniref:helix-turn-helix domain-containing protein n=1 Tax=unclassified Pseudodesulfovibrio TaxID=2661612 RepID=UPI0019D422C8|nr:helix-turn-helix transcriptional regulator [Pseudodesulfovibrio sp. S3]MCJ2165231.1 helix-turn-helix domain-containing protein [Pseudodesulfovibrio sp. S3-i]
MPTNNSQKYSAKEQEVMKRLGIRMRQLRDEAGLSQEKLAELAEVHRTYISTIERGQQNISLTVMIKLANVFQISLDELFAEI